MTNLEALMIRVSKKLNKSGISLYDVVTCKVDVEQRLAEIHRRAKGKD